MKKFLWMTALVAALALVFTGCPTSTSNKGGTTYKVTFVKGDAKDVTITNWPKDIEVEAGGSITRPYPNPSAAEFEFVNWYTTDAFKATFNFNNAKINDTTTIYAKWNVKNKPPVELVVPPDPPPTTTPAGQRKVYELSDDIIATMKAANRGSKLRLTFTVESGDWSDYGIGRIGNNEEGGISFELKAPNPAGSSFTVEVYIDWLLQALEAAGEGGKLTIMTWYGPNGESPPKNQNYTLAKIELLESAAPVDPPKMPGVPDKPEQIPMKDFIFVREINTTNGGDVDLSMGKGNISGEDFEVIIANPDGMIRLYIHNRTDPFQGKPGWGIGTIGDVGYNGKGDVDFYVDVTVQSILDKLGDKDYIFVNAYQDCAVALCELWIPDPNAAPGWDLEIYKQDASDDDFKAVINNTSHFKITNLFTRKIWNGDEYELKMTFKSDISIAALQFFLLDNSSAASWWKVLSETVEVPNIAADTEKSITITLIANFEATGNSDRANNLVIVNDDSAAVLRVTEFVFTKKKDGEPPAAVLPPLSILPPGALEISGEGFTFINAATQKGWEIEKGTQANAEKLVLNLSKAPAGGLQLIWQKTSGGWNQANGVLADNGDAVPGISTWNAATLTLTIDLTALPTDFDYANFIAEATDNVRLIIGYYSPDVDDLGIRRAYLTFVGGAAGTVFALGPFDDDEKAWYTNGVDGAVNELTPEILAASKFLVLQVTSLANNNGLGGLQLGFNGSGNGWSWTQATVTGNWTQPRPDNDGWELDYNNPDDFYIIIDLNSMDGWGEVAAGNQAKLYLNDIPGQITFTGNAYLTDIDLTKPANGVDSSGSGGTSWIVKDFSW